MKTLWRIGLGALLSSFMTASVLAHGDEKPGPNGGFIRMPGSYHIELVPQAKGAFKAFLLDVTFKNPTIKASKVNLTLMQGSKQTPLPCKVTGNAFTCQGPTNATGKLWVKSQRLGQIGADVFYELPLKHGHHHP